MRASLLNYANVHLNVNELGNSQDIAEHMEGVFCVLSGVHLTKPLVCERRTAWSTDAKNTSGLSVQRIVLDQVSELHIVASMVASAYALSTALLTRLRVCERKTAWSMEDPEFACLRVLELG